ncbi:hypothetical protein DVH02_00910 [Streptomyces corynorhini]|uniref:Uncharacterized protein n=1 Tax=Streptomyces corynorhini TaxID=2282652 RepID=A0A370BJH5_9ACTN|nr:hypothetical protein DVH02_00910 [Streptomyces corynorhini]
MAPVLDHHRHTGVGSAPDGGRETSSRITVPSTSGSSAAWSSHAARRVGRGCSRSRARAVAFPYRRVSETVIACSSPQTMLVVAVLVRVAEAPVGGGVRVRLKPRRDVHRQHRAPVGRLRQRCRDQSPT